MFTVSHVKVCKHFSIWLQPGNTGGSKVILTVGTLEANTMQWRRLPQQWSTLWASVMETLVQVLYPMRVYVANVQLHIYVWIFT